MPCKPICSADNEKVNIMQITLHYDGSFDGLLSTVFHVYACKYAPENVHITHDVQDTDLFSRSETVTTSPERAQRVFKRLEQQIGRSGMDYEIGRASCRERV